MTLEQGSFKYGTFSSDEIKTEAIAVHREMKDKGHQVSLSVATALKIGNIGKDLIMQSAPFFDNAISATDIAREISDERQKKVFLSGLGGVLIGSLLQSLEHGAFYGWDEKIFPGIFNMCIAGTPVDWLKVEDFIKNGQGQSASEATVIVRRELVRRKDFFGFSGDSRRSNLPKSISAFIDSDETWSKAFDYGFKAYKEVAQK